MKINFGKVKIKKKINFGNVRLGVKKIYPELEDIEITPSTTDKVYKSENYYGYNEVTVKGIEGVAEDLTTELTEQDNLIKIQNNSILEIIEKLQDKTGGESGFVTVKEYCVEGTKVYISLSNGQTLVIDLSENDYTELTVQELEKLIVSELETKMIGEVEG